MTKQKKDKLYEIIFKDICAKINSGKLNPGDRLPTEAEMTEIYGVSRITVTKAMTELKKNNIVSRTARKGTFVNKQINYRLSKKRVLIPLVVPLPEVENPSYKIIEGIQHIALANNCFVPICNTHNLPANETAVLEKILTMHPDGLLIYPCTEHKNIDILSNIASKNIPIVFIDKKVKGIKGCVVKTNNLKSMSSLVDTLIRFGHTKIACAISYIGSTFPETERFEGYCEALIQNGFTVRKEYLLSSGSFHEKYDKLSKTKRLSFVEEYSKYILHKYIELKDKPTAICCANDNDAINIIAMFEKHFGRMPENLTITGFDNSCHDNFEEIPTVEQNFFDIGKTAIELIFQLIAGYKLTQSEILIDATVLPKSMPKIN